MVKTKWRSKLENAMETGLMRGLYRAYMLGLAVPKMGDVFIVFNSHMAVAISDAARSGKGASLAEAVAKITVPCDCVASTEATNERFVASPML